MQLDPAELKNMAEDPKGTSMTCQHCGKTYTFTQEELASMYRKISQQDKSVLGQNIEHKLKQKNFTNKIKMAPPFSDKD